MVQPYLASVDDDGETAMLFIGGRFSHAVRKGPLLERGEGVRQDRDSRGDLRRDGPDARAAGDRRRGLRRDREARARGRRRRSTRGSTSSHDAAGRPVVLELELTEPSLFLPQAPEAAGSLVRAVEAELRG